MQQDFHLRQKRYGVSTNEHEREREGREPDLVSYVETRQREKGGGVYEIERTKEGKSQAEERKPRNGGKKGKKARDRNERKKSKTEMCVRRRQARVEMEDER